MSNLGQLTREFCKTEFRLKLIDSTKLQETLRETIHMCVIHEIKYNVVQKSSKHLYIKTLEEEKYYG